MHVLVAGQRVELLDPRLDVVPGDLLPLGHAGQVDPIEHRPVRGEHRLRIVAGQVDPEIVLGGQHGEPEPAFGDDLALRGPDFPHRGRGVAVGQHVADHEVTAGSPCSAAAAMSERKNEPSRLIRPIPAYARSRACSSGCPAILVSWQSETIRRRRSEVGGT